MAKPMYLPGSCSCSDLAFSGSSSPRNSTTWPVVLRLIIMGDTVHSNWSSTPRRAIAEAIVAKIESRMVFATWRNATPQSFGSLSMSMIGASPPSTVDLSDPRPLSPMYSECPPAMMSRHMSA